MNKLYINGNYHSIFAENDKNSEYLGSVCKKKDSEKWEIRQYTPRYDEANDITMDEDFVIKEFETEAEAIEWAKDYFSIREVK
jgi:hypothetical protein